MTDKAVTDKAIAAIDEFIKKEKVNTSGAAWKPKVPAPPDKAKVPFDAAKKYYWKLDTNKGEIKVRLMPEFAPQHVVSTIYLTRLGFYDGILFHRVIPGFMAQGGDPLGNGRGGPAYKYDSEFSPKARHDRPGILSMANAGQGTDGSQFFLTFVPTPFLNDKHTVFGEIVSGMDTMKELEKCGSSPEGTTSEKLMINKATIEVE